MVESEGNIGMGNRGGANDIGVPEGAEREAIIFSAEGEGAGTGLASDLWMILFGGSLVWVLGGRGGGLEVASTAGMSRSSPKKVTR